MIIYAHRGFSGEYPENTMPAFQKAYETGSEGIELDVHLSKDGHLVIIHDESVDRTTDACGFVRDFTLQELQEMQAGTDSCLATIPCLDEYCVWVKNLPIITNIEIKTNRYYYPTIEEKVLHMVEKYHIEEKVLISSFNHASLMRVKALNPNIRCAMLVTSKGIGNAGAYAKVMGMDYFHPDGSTLTEEVVTACHKEGVRVNVWTVDDMNLLKRVYHLGVDGIITNHPDVVLNWVKSHKD